MDKENFEKDHYIKEENNDLREKYIQEEKCIEEENNEVREIISKIRKIILDTYEKYKDNEKIKKYLKKQIMIPVGVVLVIGLFGLIAYNSSNIKAYSNIEKRLKKDIVYSDISQDINKILKDGNYSDSNKLLEIIINSDKISIYKKFIEVLKSDYSNSIDYRYAINKLFNNDNEEINNGLISLLKNNSKENNEELFIELENDNLVNNKSLFINNFSFYKENEIGNSENIYKLDIDISTLIDGLDNKDIDLKMFKGFIENKDKNNVISEILSESKKRILEDKYALVDELLKFNTEENLDEDGVYKVEIDKLNEIINLNSEINNITKEIESLDYEYKNSESFKSEKNKEVERLTKEKNNMEKDLESLQTNVDKLKPFSISGYIVGKTKDISDDIGSGEQYEVKYTVDVPYGNSDAVDRFILKTYSTQYTTKGNFTLQVVYDGIQDVSIKEDFGGFNQKWVVYSEYTGKIKSTYENALRKIDEFKSDVEYKNKEIDSVNKLLNEHNEKIENYSSIKKEKEDKINEIKNTIDEKKKNLN